MSFGRRTADTAGELRGVGMRFGRYFDDGTGVGEESFVAG